MKKIALLNIFSGNIGGGEIYFRDLANILNKDKNIDLTIISPSLTHNLDFSFLNKNQYIHIDGIPKIKYYKILPYIYKLNKQVNKLLKEKNYDLLIINGDRAVTFSPFFLKSIKKIGIRHMPIDSKVKEVLSRLSFSYLNSLVTISDFHKKNYYQKTQTKLPIHIIYNCVNRDIFLPSKIPYIAGKIKFVQIGTIEQRKGIFDTLRVFQNILKSRTDLELHLVGDGELYEQVKQFIINNNLSEYIFLHGYQKQVLNYIQNNHVVLLPSYNEGLPLILLEALSVGRLAISTKISGTPEIIQDQINGYLFDPGDLKSYESIIENLLNNKFIIEYLGLNASENLAEKFSSKTWEIKWLDLVLNEL